MGLTHRDLEVTLDQRLPALREYRYKGLSTSTKPTTLDDGTAIPAGATFEVTDTEPHEFYDWDGVKWKYRNAPTAATTTTEHLLFSILECLIEMVKNSKRVN